MTIDELRSALQRYASGEARRCVSCSQPVTCCAWSKRPSNLAPASAFYIALGVGLDGRRDVLGLWVAETEGGQMLARNLHRTQASRGLGYSISVR